MSDQTKVLPHHPQRRLFEALDDWTTLFINTAEHTPTALLRLTRIRLAAFLAALDRIIAERQAALDSTIKGAGDGH